MQISTKARYAVMALVDMIEVQHENKSNLPVKLDKISRRQDISLSYLEQLFMSLRKGGVVKSVRGPGGGYVLAREAKDIFLMDIIVSVNEPMKFNRCNGMGWIKKGHGCGVNGKACNTHELWSSFGMYMAGFLNDVSLQCVLDEKVHEILPEENIDKLLKDKETHERISG